jgi:hypothetical protein
MYRMLRVFCATSWELEAERGLFYEVVGQFNESQAMPSGVLYVPVSLTNIRDKRPYQYVVEENLRDSRHYILAVSDGWGPPERNFEDDYRLAVEYSLNPALPMRGIEIVMRQRTGAPSPFAAELSAAGLNPRRFADAVEFRREIGQLLAGWLPEDAAMADSSRAGTA